MNLRPYLAPMHLGPPVDHSGRFSTLPYRPRSLKKAHIHPRRRNLMLLAINNLTANRIHFISKCNPHTHSEQVNKPYPTFEMKMSWTFRLVEFKQSKKLCLVFLWHTTATKRRNFPFLFDDFLLAVRFSGRARFREEGRKPTRRWANQMNQTSNVVNEISSSSFHTHFLKIFFSSSTLALRFAPRQFPSEKMLSGQRNRIIIWPTSFRDSYASILHYLNIIAIGFNRIYNWIECVCNYGPMTKSKYTQSLFAATYWKADRLDHRTWEMKW